MRFLLLFELCFVVWTLADSTRGTSPNAKPRCVHFQSRSAKVFGIKGTTTITDVSITTSEVFFSCLVGTDAQPCGKKRKKKRDLQNPLEEVHIENNLVLDTSIDSSNSFDSSYRDGRFWGITLWSTTRKTTTITLFSTNTSTTLRLSYYCIAGMINLPMFNCLAPAR